MPARPLFRLVPGGSPAARAFPWARGAAAAVLVLVLCALHGASLHDFFFRDDGALLLRARETGLGELLERSLPIGWAGRDQWYYWRPGWWSAIELGNALFGLEPFGYRVAAVALHAFIVLGLQALVARWTRSEIHGLLAGLFLATTPAPIEAVVWMSAATNVLPAAALIGASGVLWFHGLVSNSRAAAAGAVVLGALSLLFREAAYHLPLFFVGAWLLVRGFPRGVRDLGRLALPAGLLLALVLYHYTRLNEVAPPTFAPLERALRIGASLASLAQLFVPADAGARTALLAAVLLLGGLSWQGSARTRCFLLWTVLATLPYAAASYFAHRFAYFPALPLAIALGLGARDAGERFGKRAGAAASAALAVLALANALRFPAALEGFRREARVAQRVLDDCRTLGVDRFERVCAGSVPHAVAVSFEALLRLYLAPSLVASNARIVVHPPFAIHVNDILEEGPGHGFLRVHPRSGAVTLVTRQQLLKGLVPIPLISFRGRWRVVADHAEALRQIRAGQADLAHEVLLLEAPDRRLGAPGQGADVPGARLLRVARSPGRVDIDVEVPAATLMVLAWMTSGDPEVTVDGRPTRVLEANGPFHALALPAGSRRVTWLGGSGL